MSSKVTGFLIAGTFLLVGVGIKTLSVSQENQSTLSSAGIMRLKLEPAKNILEGIAVADFQAVRKHTEQLRLLTLDSKWMVLQSEGYRTQTKNFERSLNLLNRMCDEKDMDGVTLAYMQVAMRCVECHRMIRDGK